MSFESESNRTCLYPYDEEQRHVSGYLCRCHERMGNDFWFLPTRACLFDEELEAQLRYALEQRGS